MSSPLAVLNVEELHWQNDLGLPNQRRWLNHRNIGDGHRRTFPSAAGILTQIISDLRFQIEDCPNVRRTLVCCGPIYGSFMIKRSLKLRHDKLKFVGHSGNLKFEILNLKLSEGKFACAALFVLETTSDF